MPREHETNPGAFPQLLSAMSPYITILPDWLWGQPSFRNTRVLVGTLFDYHEHGQTLEDFLRDFESVDPKGNRNIRFPTLSNRLSGLFGGVAVQSTPPYPVNAIALP